jgi:hypothetical protein
MKYAYFLSENRETDCYSTTFEFVGQKNIELFGWNFNFDLGNVHYLVIDDTLGNRNIFKYENSKNIKYFKFKVIDEDIDRNILTIEITEEFENLDVIKFKRDIRIDKLLNI